MSDLPTWERRFRAPLLAFPSWASDAPDRLVMASTESGSYQLHTWDRATGERRQVTDDPVGVLEGRPTRDGTGVIWFHDATGAESGKYVIAPFDERVAPEPLIEGLPEGWTEGLAIGRTRTVAGLSTEESFSVWVSERGGVARKLHEHREPVRLAGGWGLASAVERRALSSDESIVVLEVMEDGDVLHPSLRSIDTETGETVAELRDENRQLSGSAFSPVAGDNRIAIAHERTGEERPALWDARTGEVVDLPLTLDGPVEPVDWWPDGSALLLLQLTDGRNRLHRYDLASGALTTLDTEPGSITAAAVRPDGEVWYRVHNGLHPATLLAVGSTTPLLEAEGPGAPAGRPFESWWFENPKGQRVHGFLVRPEGDGPHPVIMRVHGGPHSLDMDRWVPDIQAHVDAGFLVAMVNYRGSTGYGQAWRDELTGNVGFLELEDVLAGLDDIVARGLADPARVVLAGWSWGGYVTLLGLGRHPDRWISGIGGVPVADYVAAYEDESPILQALDRALFGGSPETAPVLFHERNPLTYADDVRAPVLIMAGENDSRCPIRQVWNYVGRLRRRGLEPEVYTYATGHASYDVEERVRQTAIVLDFLARTVPGVTRLEGLDAHLTAAGVAAA
ncbi:MAG TPA: prolyl oligopeptidase family serine peptidase [Candidatus Limnocylindrales bacterium]|jgi:dipeptidyl aminopeptidase/acylaminoacyl peptidase